MVDQKLASDVSFQEESNQSVSIPRAPTSVCGMVGIAQRGPLSEQIVNGFDEWQRIYGDYIANSDAVHAVKGFFDNGGTELHFVRVVHCTTASDPTSKTSAAATLNLSTSVQTASAGSVQSSNSAPWALNPGDTLAAKIDGGGAVTATFNATAASRTAANAAPYALVNNQTLLVAIDGGSVATITFVTSEFVAIGAATAAEVAAVINAYFAQHGIGAVADVNANAVRITSNRKGTGSGVNVSGGTANATLGFTTGNVAGTGNVSNIAAVTTAEAISVAGAAFAGATVTAPGGFLKVTSNTTGGASSVQIQGSSTAIAEFGFDSAIHTGGAAGTQATLQVNAKTDGTYGNALQVVIGAATNGDAAHFNLYVVQSGVTVERWPNLSMNSAAKDYALTVVNDVNTGSNLIALVDLAATFASPANLPATGTFGPLTGGGDGLAGLADTDFIGGESTNGTTGLRSLDSVLTLSLLTVPGRATAAVHNAMITYCEITREGSVFAILDPPTNQSATQIVTYVKYTAALQELSEYAALYWPNILVDNPSTTVFGTATTITVPPSGHIAGMFARVDGSQPSGVWQTPAGRLNGTLLNVRGVEMAEVLKKPKREIVFPELVNPIRRPDRGGAFYVDGARTLKSTGNFPTVGERRGVIYLESSLREGLDEARQRNITDRLLDECFKAARGFLEIETNNGAFATTDPALAFSVDFGPGLNTAATRKARTIVGRVGLATAKPAEFIIVKITPDSRALDAQLAQLAAAA